MGGSEESGCGPMGQGDPGGNEVRGRAAGQVEVCVCVSQALFSCLGKDPFGCHEVNGLRRAREEEEGGGIWEAVSVVQERQGHTWMMVEFLRTDQVRGSA